MALALVLLGLAFIAQTSAHDDAHISVACFDRPANRAACEDASMRCHFREGLGCVRTSFRRLDDGARDSKGHRYGAWWKPAVMAGVPALICGCCLGYIVLRCCRRRGSDAKGSVPDVQAGNVVIGVPVGDSQAAATDGKKQVE
eukprot:TRINITY_DN6866_c0_g3_i1.p1 TRINITY_DN6866_c0_g3~~TRINITY_DN6866_c0_g3_i1.p1  ORF type:complete len:143 (-),score=25.40 TRINITY_DN6866_c0_g3_i1:238-666(-)